jgi:hypothetical protein
MVPAGQAYCCANVVRDYIKTEGAKGITAKGITISAPDAVTGKLVPMPTWSAILTPESCVANSVPNCEAAEAKFEELKKFAEKVPPAAGATLEPFFHLVFGWPYPNLKTTDG